MLTLLRSAWKDREVNGQLRVSRTLLKEDTWLEENTGNTANLQGKSVPPLSDHMHIEHSNATRAISLLLHSAFASGCREM